MVADRQIDFHFFFGIGIEINKSARLGSDLLGSEKLSVHPEVQCHGLAVGRPLSGEAEPDGILPGILHTMNRFNRARIDASNLSVSLLIFVDDGLRRKFGGNRHLAVNQRRSDISP
jgi:hypothetical protein